MKGPGSSPNSGAAPAVDQQVVTTGEVAPGPRWLLVVLGASAGVIHLVVAPPHFDETTIDGITFLAAGWAQLLLAAAIVLRPRRAVAAATAAVNALLIGAWVMAHSVGLPYGSHKGAAEAATFVAQVCLALEIAVVAVAVVAALNPAFGRDWKKPGLAFAAIASVGVLVLTTAAIASPTARGGGHESAAGSGAHSHGGATGEGKVADDRGYSDLENGHQHGHAADVALDPQTEILLQQQLVQSHELAAEFPTVADAEAAGYRRAGPFAPGLGAHYMQGLGSFGAGPDDLPAAAPEVGTPMLIFDGTDPDAQIAGFMYNARSFSGEPAEGFAGPNDRWHYHTNVCVTFGPEGIGAPLGADHSATQAQCDAFGGTLIAETNWMVHVWTVPGYASSDGLFSNINPALNCPDGSYYQAPAEEWGTAASTCLSA